MKNYKLDKTVFTQNDLTTLLISLKSLADNLSPIQHQQTLAKIKRLVPKASLKEIEFKSQQIAIDLAPWTNNQQIQPNLSTIKTALDNHQLIAFDYEDRKGALTIRTIEPYRLTLKEISWYLEGYALERKDFRTFKLSRISNLSLLKEKFVPRPFYPKPLGRSPWIEDKLEMITLRIQRSLKDLIVDKFGSFTIVEENNSELIIELPFMIDDYGYGILLSFGTKSECLKPLFIRQTLKEKANEIAAIYQ